MNHRQLPQSSRTIVRRLYREWNVLAHRPSVLRRASSWGLEVPFRSLDDIVEATGFWTRQEARLEADRAASAGSCAADRSSGNDVMMRLLVAARADEVAARVVLQRLLPGLITRARRWVSRPEGGPEALDELLSAAWTVIRTHPVERRPSHLVANLLRDAEYHAFVRPHRRTLVHELTPTDLLDGPAKNPTIEPMAELAEVVAAARTLTAHDRKLFGLLVSGVAISEVATQLEVSVRTVGNHRDVLVHRLRQAAAEMAAA